MSHEVAETDQNLREIERLRAELAATRADLDTLRNGVAWLGGELARAKAWAAGGAVGIVGKESGMSNVEEAQRLIDALNRAGNRHAARYAAIPYSVARLADDTYLAKLERVLNKAHARLLRRWQAQVAREMNEYEAARLAKLLEVPSDGRRF